MKVHISRIPEELLEFNKTDNVVVTMILNSTEARRIREEFHLDALEPQGAAPGILSEALAAVEDGSDAIRQFNAVND